MIAYASLSGIRTAIPFGHSKSMNGLVGGEQAQSNTNKINYAISMFYLSAKCSFRAFSSRNACHLVAVHSAYMHAYQNIDHILLKIGCAKRIQFECRYKLVCFIIRRPPSSYAKLAYELIEANDVDI